MKTIYSRSQIASISQLKLAIVVLALGSHLLLLAQEDLPQQANALSARDIVGPYLAEALGNNPGLVAHDKRYEAARQTLSSTGALPNPKVQISHFVESIQTRTGPQKQALMLQQPIPWLGKLDRKRDIARAHSNALWQAYAAQQFKLVDQVAKRVLDIAFLDKSISINIENIDLLKRLESIVEEKVRSGGALSDLLRLQVEIQRFEDNVAKQETQRFEATARLDSLLGRSTNKPHPTISWQAPKAIVESGEQWLTAIQEQSPQIAMLRAIESSQEARERLANLAKRPDFSVGLNYIRTGGSLNPSTPDNGKDPWALMVGMSLPIWGKANTALALYASLEKEAVSAQIQDLKLTLRGEGRAWIARLEDAQTRILRYDAKLLPLARQAQEITQSSYQSGQSSILDLIDSDRSLLRLETEYWRAAADVWLARWKLATLSGGLWLN